MLDLLNISILAWTESPQRTDSCQAPPSRYLKRPKRFSVKCPATDLRRARAHFILIPAHCFSSPEEPSQRRFLKAWVRPEYFWLSGTWHKPSCWKRFSVAPVF